MKWEFSEEGSQQSAPWATITIGTRATSQFLEPTYLPHQLPPELIEYAPLVFVFLKESQNLPRVSPKPVKLKSSGKGFKPEDSNQLPGWASRLLIHVDLGEKSKAEKPTVIGIASVGKAGRLRIAQTQEFQDTDWTTIQEYSMSSKEGLWQLSLEGSPIEGASDADDLAEALQREFKKHATKCTPQSWAKLVGYLVKQRLIAGGYDEEKTKFFPFSNKDELWKRIGLEKATDLHDYEKQLEDLKNDRSLPDPTRKQRTTALKKRISEATSEQARLFPWVKDTDLANQTSANTLNGWRDVPRKFLEHYPPARMDSVVLDRPGGIKDYLALNEDWMRSTMDSFSSKKPKDTDGLNQNQLIALWVLADLDDFVRNHLAKSPPETPDPAALLLEAGTVEIEWTVDGVRPRRTPVLLFEPGD